jgi:hypothetical protein
MIVGPAVTYVVTVKFKTRRTELSKLQRLAYLGTTGAMKTAPTAAIEVLLGLPSLHLQLEPMAKARIYRLCYSKQWKTKSKGYGHAYMSQDMKEEPILQMGAD